MVVFDGVYNVLNFASDEKIQVHNTFLQLLDRDCFTGKLF